MTMMKLHWLVLVGFISSCSSSMGHEQTRLDADTDQAQGELQRHEDAISTLSDMSQVPDEMDQHQAAMATIMKDMREAASDMSGCCSGSMAEMSAMMGLRTPR